MEIQKPHKSLILYPQAGKIVPLRSWDKHVILKIEIKYFQFKEEFSRD